MMIIGRSTTTRNEAAERIIEIESYPYHANFSNSSLAAFVKPGLVSARLNGIDLSGSRAGRTSNLCGSK